MPSTLYSTEMGSGWRSAYETYDTLLSLGESRFAAWGLWGEVTTKINILNVEAQYSYEEIE